MTRGCVLVCCIAVWVLGGAMASADTITYDLAGGANSIDGVSATGTLLATETATEGGVTATLRGFDENGDASALHLGNNGLGVAGAPGANRVGVNSAGGESIEIDFTPGSVMALSSVTFERGAGSNPNNGNFGEIMLFVDGVDTATYDWAVNGVGTFVINESGMRFRFEAMDGSFRIRSFTFQAVPEPATLALLGLGVGGLAWRRRRTRSA